MKKTLSFLLLTFLSLYLHSQHTIPTTEYIIIDGTENGNSGVITDAINALNFKGTITIKGDVQVNGSKIIPEGIELKFFKGNKLKIANNVTLTINGNINAGIYQIFDIVESTDPSDSGKINGKPIIERVYPQWFGAKGDSVTDDTKALQNSIIFAIESGRSLYLPTGDYNVTSTLDANNIKSIPNNSIFLKIYGDHLKSSRITTEKDIEVLRIRHNFKIENISIVQKNSNQKGKGISFPFASYNSEFRSLYISGFEYGIWGKWAIWDTFSDIILKDNKIGIELHRNDLDGNPPANWNTEPEGWFNNVINFFNVYVDGGEIGIKAYGMGMSFIGCTTQNQINTGIWIEGGTSTNRTWNNLILNHYAEYTKRVFYIKDARYTKIESFFTQGGPQNNRLNTVIELDNSRVKVEGSTGQDWWVNKAILKNQSILQGDIVAVGGDYKLYDESIRLPEFSTKKYTLDHLTADRNWHNIPGLTLEKGHTYRITLSGIRDGYDTELSEFILFYFDGSHYILKEITKKNLEVRISSSGNSIDARLDYIGGYPMATTSYLYIEDLNKGL
jgi:hypothetical protein